MSKVNSILIKYKFTLLILIILLFNIAWLILLVIPIAGCIGLNKLINLPAGKYYITFPGTILSIICLSTFIHLFIFEIYKVPSDSMEDAFFPGNYILVSKLNYGPRLPRSSIEIPWLNLFVNANYPSNLQNRKKSWWPYFRINGFSVIKRQDVVVFKKRESDDDFLVKRCIGLPGEKLQVKDEIMIVNDRLVQPLITCKFRYTLKITSQTAFRKIAERYHITYSILPNRNGLYISVTVNSLTKKIIVQSGTIEQIIHTDFNIAIPFSSFVKWTANHWGPIVVPAKGMTVRLDSLNINLYSPLIISETTVRAEDLPTSRLTIRLGSFYTFKKNYYFMMGDNRDNSSDSRFWGLLSEENIIGKEILSL